MRPGRSAKVIYFSSMYFTTPRWGQRVVKGYSAIFGNALVVAARRVDLPEFGNPINPMSAKSFNSKKTFLFYPGIPD